MAEADPFQGGAEVAAAPFQGGGGGGAPAFPPEQPAERGPEEAVGSVVEARGGSAGAEQAWREAEGQACSAAAAVGQQLRLAR